MIGERKLRLRTYLGHVASGTSLPNYRYGFVAWLGVAIATVLIVASTS